MTRANTSNPPATKTLVMVALLVALVGGVMLASKLSTTLKPKQAIAQPLTAQQVTSQSGLISSEQAVRIATSYVAGNNNVSDVTCDLHKGSSAPRYEVKYHYDDADYLVKVDARDGSVWYATAIYNDGTTQDVTKPANSEPESTDAQQEPQQ